MPQLDYTLLFNQLFWLFFIFVILYIVLIYFFLPLLLKVFRVRKQILSKNFNESKKIIKYIEKFDLFYKIKIFEYCQLIKPIFSFVLFLKNYEINLLKTKLIPILIIHFISHKILYNQFFKIK